MGMPALPSPCSAAARVRAAPLLTSRTRTGGAALGGGVAAQSAVRRSRTARSPPPSIWRNGVGRADPGAIVPATRCVPVGAARHPLSGGMCVGPSFRRQSSGSSPAGRPDSQMAAAQAHAAAICALRPGFVAHRAGTTRPLPFGRGKRLRAGPVPFQGSWLARSTCLSPRPPAQSSSNTWSINHSRGFIPCRGVGEVPSKHRVPDSTSGRPDHAAASRTVGQVVVTPRTLLALRSPTHDAQLHTLPSRVAKHPRPATRGPSISIGVSRSGPGPPADGDQQVERVTTPRTISDQALGRVMGFLAPVSQRPLRRAPRIAGLPHGQPACLRHDPGSRPDA